ncbi:hypothetical protein ABIE44_002469 [Marmoricola sp. OAE513]|uniref:hypothetical protein n=1 Tax=Marmoricola sp. OAE513 TaxID=2817894 RepID=UPI001AE93147
MLAVRKRLLAAALAVVPVAAALVAVSPTADARTSWASESAATIKPGVQMYTKGAQCTANFVFRDKAGNVYVGYAAHCAGLGESSDTNGCTTKSLPLGTPVQFVTGGNFFSSGKTVGTGKLAYSSWASMAKLKTKDGARCAYNDFALVKVDSGSVKNVNPTVPGFGGPTGLAAPPLAAKAPIYTIGNSSLRTGNASKKTGKVLNRVAGTPVLAYDIQTGSPGIPGDSGSGFMDGAGRAAGVLSTLSVGISLTPVTNTMGNIVYELAWAQKYSGIKGLVLVNGTRGFKK